MLRKQAYPGTGLVKFLNFWAYHFFEGVFKDTHLRRIPLKVRAISAKINY